MRETLFILGIIGVLIILTAVRYRKQILGAIGFARALKEAGTRPVVAGERTAGVLVQCEDCGVRLPEVRAKDLGGGRYRCLRGCLKVRNS